MILILFFFFLPSLRLIILKPQQGRIGLLLYFYNWLIHSHRFALFFLYIHLEIVTRGLHVGILDDPLATPRGVLTGRAEVARPPRGTTSNHARRKKGEGFVWTPPISFAELMAPNDVHLTLDLSPSPDFDQRIREDLDPLADYRYDFWSFPG